MNAQSGEYNDDKNSNNRPTSKGKRHQKRPKQEPLAYPFRSSTRHGSKTKSNTNSNYQQQHQGSLGSGYAAVMAQVRPPMNPTAVMMMMTNKYSNNKEHMYRQVAKRPGGGGRGGNGAPSDANKHQATIKKGQVMVTIGNNDHSPMPQGNSRQQRQQEYGNMRQPPFGMPMVYRL